MNKALMKDLIDSENGEGFSKNIDLNGYNFYKNNTFISFKIFKVEDIPITNIKYIYSENKKDLLTVLTYCINFWMAMKIKFIYYKEKEKGKDKKYVIEELEKLGFTIITSDIKTAWKYNFKCKKGENPCKCNIIEAFS